MQNLAPLASARFGAGSARESDRITIHRDAPEPGAVHCPRDAVRAASRCAASAGAIEDRDPRRARESFERPSRGERRKGEDAGARQTSPRARTIFESTAAMRPERRILQRGASE